MKRQNSNSNSVSDVATGCLRSSGDLEDLALFDPEVPGDGVLNLDLWKLEVSHPVLLEDVMLLLGSKDLVLGNQLVLSNVHHQLVLGENLDLAWSQGVELFAGDACSPLQNHDGRQYVQLTHFCGDLLDCVGANLLIAWVEDEDLLVVDGEGISRGLALVGGIALLKQHVERLSRAIEVRFESLNGLVEALVTHGVSSVS